MRKSTSHKGKEGEQIARAFLESKGFQILATNFRYRRSEIDLIAFKEPFLVFVEVKLRKSASFGYPEQFVDEAKAERILQAAEAYMSQHPSSWQPRFDIISILAAHADHVKEITHFEDAFGS